MRHRPTKYPKKRLLGKVIVSVDVAVAFLHSQGHSATSPASPATSVLLSTTDVDRTFYDVSNVPLSDIRIVERMTVFSGEVLEIRRGSDRPADHGGGDQR
jgi:hypothetical protein